jgi:hypothetical protein
LPLFGEECETLTDNPVWFLEIRACSPSKLRISGLFPVVCYTNSRSFALRKVSCHDRDSPYLLVSYRVRRWIARLHSSRGRLLGSALWLAALCGNQVLLWITEVVNTAIELQKAAPPPELVLESGI